MRSVILKTLGANAFHELRRVHSTPNLFQFLQTGIALCLSLISVADEDMVKLISDRSNRQCSRMLCVSFAWEQCSSTNH